MYMPAQIQLKTVEMVEIEPESDVMTYCCCVASSRAVHVAASVGDA